MAPSKPSNNKVETTPYTWCLNKKEDADITLSDLYSSYRVNYTQCGSYCRRTCKRNPRCLWGFGEKKWIRNNEESHSDEEDEQPNRNEGQLAGIANLGATCYVNSLLQLWFHNPILRPAILNWKPNNIHPPQSQQDVTSSTKENIYKPNCPISHLQAMFARMLMSKRSTIDPKQFTTSLELNTGEQQDAQEFSNLLMTLLDTLLEKHQSKEIQNLIKDSFTGTYSYETICAHCQTGSVTNCDFRELELMVKRNLKESITDYLKVETLSDKNQYNCGTCGLPRDAKRRIKIVKLPPVLNLQLMRFIYDRETQQKKKNKLQITFPETLNMTEFIGNKDDQESNTYILNAVLSHKGRNAHHGHYIAHIKDMSTGNWFECNDDSVQPVKSTSKTLIIKNDEANNNSTGDVNKETEQGKTEYKSDGAYMLVYTRKSYMDTNKTFEIHDYLKNLVTEEDKIFDEEYVKNKTTRDNETKRKEQRQEEINLLYRDLQPKTNVAATTKNENNTAPPNNAALPNTNLNDTSAEDMSNNSSPNPLNPTIELNFIANNFLPALFDLKTDVKIENKSIVCRHGKLKPPSPNDTSVPYRIVPTHFSDVIYSRYECDIRLSGNSVLCLECVKTNCIMLNRLASLDEDFKMFTELNKTTELTDNVWISNELLKGWKKHAKIEIELEGKESQVTKNGDMDVDDGDVNLMNSELRCDHDSLNPSVSKTSVSIRAWTIITKYFPTAVIWPQDIVECQTCANISQSNSYVQQQNKLVASNQKSTLSDLYQNRHRPNLKEMSGDFYILPTAFVQEWRKFIKDPTKISFPMLQFALLLCPQHELLMYPVHMMDQLLENGVLEESFITIITEPEWQYLKEELSVDTEIKISVDEEFVITYVSVQVCPECSIDWWTNECKKIYMYENGNIYIEKRDDLNEVLLLQDTQNSQDYSEDDFIQSNGKREKREREPIRRSKRTRFTKNVKKYSYINSCMSVKDFQKLYLVKDYAAILSDQHLYHNGKELNEKERGQTFGELGIQSNSNLVLIVDPQPKEGSDIKDMEVDTHEPPQPENGFRGTILLGGG